MHNSAYTSTYSTLLPSLKRARIIEASEPECIRILDRLYSRNFSVNYVTNGEGEEEEGIKVPVYRFYAKSSRVLLDGPTNYTPNREFYKLSRCESARVRTVMFVITCGSEILFPMIRFEISKSDSVTRKENRAKIEAFVPLPRKDFRFYAIARFALNALNEYAANKLKIQ